MFEQNNYKYLLCEKKDRIGYITINNLSKMNALSEEILLEIGQVMVNINNDESIHVVVITGQKNTFIAGADISAMKDFSPIQAKNLSELGSKIFRSIELSSKIIIAALNGYTLGGGLELAMACDIRIASSSAKLGLPEVSLGIIPGFSGTQRLPLLVGIAKAKELIFTGNMIGAEEACRIGLVNQVTMPEELMNTVEVMAHTILKHPVSSQKVAKKVINTMYAMDAQKGIELESSLFAYCFTTGDAQKGMEAFLNKR